VDWHIAMRPSKRKIQKHTPWGALAEQAEKLKVSVWAKVEHPNRVIKRQFGHSKVRYRGRAKNTAQLITLFALSKIWMARKLFCKRLRNECVCKQSKGCDVGETSPAAATTGCN
jgi:IS5 family transposase